MPALAFDDLVPKANTAQNSNALSFDDLIPQAKTGYIDSIANDDKANLANDAEVSGQVQRGEINPLSGLLQHTKNAVSPITNVMGETIKQIPGYDTAMSGLQKGAQATSDFLDQNPTVQKGADFASDQMQKHPEAVEDVKSLADISQLFGLKPAADLIEGGIGGAKTALQASSDNAAATGAEIAAKPVPSGLTSSQGFDIAKRAYNAADATGGNLAPQAVNTWLDNSAKILPQTNEAKVALGETPATQFMDRIQAFRDKPLSFQAADEIDKGIGGKITSAMRSGDKEEAARLSGIQDNLRQAVQTLPDTSSNITEAKQAFSASSKMRDVENILTDAQSADVPATAIKNGFKSLAKQLRNNPKGYTPEEIDAIEDASKTGLVTGLMKTLGGKLISHMTALAAGAGGGAVGGLPGAIAGFSAAEGGGYAMRQAAAAMQRAKGQKVLDILGNRPVFNQKAPIPAKLPPAPLALPDIGRLLDGLASGKIPGYAALSTSAKQQTIAPETPTKTTIKTEPLSYSYKESSPNTSMMDAFAKAESGNNPNARNPNSSASGLMQFTNRTWADMVNKYGQQTGIKLSDKNDPKAQTTMAALYAQDNVKSLQNNLGRMPTKGELYMAHMLGPVGAAKLISADPNKEALMLFPRPVTDANRTIFYNGKVPRTAGQVYAILNQKVS